MGQGEDFSKFDRLTYADGEIVSNARRREETMDPPISSRGCGSSIILIAYRRRGQISVRATT
jgi:hypothetical protein